MGSFYPTMVCRLCGGRIDGHKVITDAPVRGKVIRTTCAEVGAELDKRALLLFPTEPTPTWKERLGRECALRRQALMASWQQGEERR